jgi:hypothetical protein
VGDGRRPGGHCSIASGNIQIVGPTLSAFAFCLSLVTACSCQQWGSGQFIVGRAVWKCSCQGVRRLPKLRPMQRHRQDGRFSG